MVTIRLTIGNDDNDDDDDDDNDDDDDDDDDDDEEDDDEDDKNDEDDEQEDIRSMECRARVKLAVRHFHRATALSARSSGGSWGGGHPLVPPPLAPPGTPPWSWGVGGGTWTIHSLTHGFTQWDLFLKSNLYCPQHY